MSNAKVVVVGTGPSGIAAATKLLELGFQNVVLVEAENRIGGRIHTIPFADNVVDLGAQWCHGEKGSVVHELAAPLNLVEHSSENFSKFEVIRSNKELIPDATFKRIIAIIDDKMENQELSIKNYKGSLGSYIDEKFFEALKLPENSDIDLKTAKEVLECYKKFQNSLNACDTMNDLSAKNFVESWDCEGDLYMNWKGKGYHRFLQLLLKSDEKNELGVLQQRVKLGKPVKTINWGDDGVKLKCVDGEIIEADHAIVTVSLGVLKAKHSNMFEPNLPVEKIRAIETIGFGTVNKIYLEFSTKFWPNDWVGSSFVWREEDLKEIRGTNRAWLENLYGFFHVEHQPRILCGWMVSAGGRHMETLPKDEVLNGSLFLLRKFLKWEIPTPINFKPSAWSTSENFKGSYSYQSVLAEEANAKPSDLAAPLVNSEKKPVVLFAGEATHDHYFSTVHGAVETGWREAKRLAELYTIKQTK